MKKTAVSSLLIAGILACGTSLAAEHKIKMLNKGADGMFVFEPGYLKVNKGDTVTFSLGDKGHIVQSEVTPDGNSWKGEPNKPFSITLSEEGVVTYSCLPHKMMGMVGVIQVGEPTNLSAAKEAANKMKFAQNKDRMIKYLAEVK